MEKMELRFIDAELISTDEGLEVSGYVNKTNQWSEVLGVRKKFVERILPGAFTRALQAGNEIHFLAEHDNAKILASTRNSSLELREDEIGLFMTAKISPTSWGKDYHTLITDGIIKNMSFGMAVLKDSWKKLNDGMYERSISDIYLAEVSAVRSPAYIQSTIAARSIELVEDVEIPSEIKSENEENREESNQMEITVETRDKLVEAIEMLHGLLKDNQAAKEVAPEIKEVVEKVAESVQEVVDEVVEAAEEVTEVVAEVVEKVVDKAQEAVKEVAEEVKDVVEAVDEVVADVVEIVKDVVVETVVTEDKPAEKAPDLSEFYKKLLDLA